LPAPLHVGRRVGAYEIGGCLGRGQFASVNMATNVRSARTVAAKIILPGKMDPAKIQREVENQRGLRHPNIIQLLDILEEDGAVFIIMERAMGGDLFELIIKRSRLPEAAARLLFRQIIEGIAFCHRNMVVHRDLKPENIFLDANMNVKLGDFGLSTKFEWGTFLTESVGSPNYAAPELLQRNCSYQGPEVDVWAVGCVLFAMITGTLPFDPGNDAGSNFSALFKLIKSGAYRVPGYVSAEARSMISGMLTVDREERISTAGIRQHAWWRSAESVTLPKKCEVKESVTNPKLLAEMLMAIADGDASNVSQKIKSCRSFGHVTAKRRASYCSSAFGSFARAVSMESVVTKPAC